MRISDWSSDVCSSDLSKSGRLLWGRIFFQPCGRRAEIARGILPWLGMAAMRHDFPALNPDGMIAVRYYEPPSDLIEMVGSIYLFTANMPHVSDHVRADFAQRSEEHTSELQSLMRISYAVFCLKKKKHKKLQKN